VDLLQDLGLKNRQIVCRREGLRSGQRKQRGDGKQASLEVHFSRLLIELRKTIEEPGILKNASFVEHFIHGFYDLLRRFEGNQVAAVDDDLPSARRRVRRLRL